MSIYHRTFILTAVTALTFISCESPSGPEVSLSQSIVQMEQKDDLIVHKRPGNCQQQCQYQEEIDILKCNRLYSSDPVNLDDCLAKADLAYLNCLSPCPPAEVP